MESRRVLFPDLVGQHSCCYLYIYICIYGHLYNLTRAMGKGLFPTKEVLTTAHLSWWPFTRPSNLPSKLLRTYFIYNLTEDD